ncbi:sigma-70 family RNA polymerase sigma factor [Streptomyces sp. YS415]|uniref:sigma-70 family RNA polymerase sigma factor n=1 Tax=Streptomyces sp. YS415 TaxID=2944806 RepID=UPI00201FDFD0|nr:sigma-70 family RNA polymerase sigma factor [Streptomyces sp. YS415]MCL7429380.1 sigma-70 family RNA polymerase sigma factor [Streptomyces sp. YS415]
MPLLTTADERRDRFIRDLYEQHGRSTLRYAARLLGGDWHRAEDVLQEAALRAWKHAAALGLNASQVRPWLWTTVRNLTIDHHRAEKRRPADCTELDTLDLSVPDETDRLLRGRLVLDALSDLTEQQRQVICLLYYGQFNAAQAAEHLGIPLGTVKSRSYYALRALKRALEIRGALVDVS